MTFVAPVRSKERHVENRMHAALCWQLKLISDGADTAVDFEGADVPFGKLVERALLNRELSIGPKT